MARLSGVRNAIDGFNNSQQILRNLNSLDEVDQVIDCSHAGLHETPVQLHDGVTLLDASLLANSTLKDLGYDDPCGKFALCHPNCAHLQQEQE